MGRDDDWLDQWAPECPDGNPQRVLEILGFRLKGPDYLQLRVVVRRFDPGICQVVLDEAADRIHVRVIACLPPDEGPLWDRPTEMDCPCNVWLDEPLGEKVVIDVDTGDELPLFVPRWGTEDRSFYMPRPPGLLWPPDDMPAAG